MTIDRLPADSPIRVVALARRIAPIQTATRRFLDIHLAPPSTKWVLSSEGNERHQIRDLLSANRRALLVLPDHFPEWFTTGLPLISPQPPVSLVLLGQRSSSLKLNKSLLHWVSGRIVALTRFDGPALLQGLLSAR